MLSVVALQQVGLPGGEERGDRDPGQDQRGRRAVPAAGRPEQVGQRHRADRADERGQRHRHRQPRRCPSPVTRSDDHRGDRRGRRRPPRRAGTGRPAGCGRRPGSSRRRGRASPPTSSPSTTRGSRSSVTIAISRSLSPLSMRTPGMRLSSSAATLPGGRLTGPNAMPDHGGDQHGGDAAEQPAEAQPAARTAPGRGPPRAAGCPLTFARGRPAAARHAGTLATASTIARSRSTTRGPHREAMSSSSTTIWLFLTAVMPAQPLRALTVSGVLLAALGVGQEDQVRVGLDQRLRVSCG